MPGGGCMKLPEEFLKDSWERLDFEDIRKKLFDMQCRIASLTKDDQTEERIELQERLTNKLEFRCLAVNQVANTSKSPGVDGVMWKTSAEKMQAAYDLVSDTFQASPLRIWKVKQKNNGKIRRYAIPTFHDRAMCVLHGYALLPIVEVYGDRKSFCCRKGRSRYDAHAYLMNRLKGADAPRYVVTTDVKSYYATLSHGWLMKNVPMNKRVLYELLHANIIESGELFSREGVGISEGSNLSPYIGNFALDGLQNYIYKGLYGDGDFEENGIDYANGDMIRYADDIFVSVRTPEQGLRVLQLLDEFVKVRGLQLNEEKTNIIAVEDGFDFLKFHFVKKNGVVISYPSVQSVQRIKADICDIVELNIRNQRKLIEALNAKLKSWGNTYKFCDAKEVFREVDGYVHNLLFDAVQQLHPTFTEAKVYERYWYTDFLGRRYFAIPKQREVRVMHLEDIVLVNYTPVKVSMNPFLDVHYFEERTGVTPEHNVTSRYRPIWERQGGKCFYCGHPFLNDQAIQLITIDPAKPDRMENKAYIHNICAENEYLTHYTLDDLDGMTPAAIDEMLVYADAEKKVKVKLKGDWKYRKLEDYFEKSKRNRMMLSFQKLEKISGYGLSESMKKDKNRWKAFAAKNTMPDAWEAEGYRIAALDLKKETVVFEKTVTGRAKLEIPAVLLESEIPVHVKEEIEHYLKTIIRERGITKNRRNI
jgi:group II intron reverse transcriptase/maturase